MRDVKWKSSDDLVPLAVANIAEEEVSAQVETLCHSPAFENQENARKLLRYLVGPNLAGKEPTPREIALSGLGMQNFGPGDSHVRNTANKLRECLEEHYASAEAKPGEIRLWLPARRYWIQTPKPLAGNAQSPRPTKSRMVGVIVEPAEMAEVYQRVTVRGRIDALHPDLRAWLVVETPVGDHYPQCRVSRKNPQWECEVRIGLLQWGSNEGAEYVIQLVAADADGDSAFYQYLKSGRDGFGPLLPTDSTVLDSRRVTRRDLRPQAPRASG